MEININVAIGKRIRYLRKQKNISIEDLAFLSDINRNYLSDLERGQRNPTIKILAKIIDALEYDFPTFFASL